MKRFEDLIDRSKTVGAQAAILESKKKFRTANAREEAMLERLIAIRTASRRDIVKQFDKEENENENEHRLEYLQFQEVNFVNDSKSCTINATYYSFDTIKSDVIWIAGGDDAKSNYKELLGHVSQRVKMLICIGENNQKLNETFSEYISSIHEERNMEDAVRLAFYSATRKDIILLSTGCECDNLYSNYQARGNSFKTAIAQL
jgi:UDP-N-acetylmuramoylalanine--D-glutamate ligase